MHSETFFSELCSLLTGEGANYGVDINTGGIADSFANFVWEPAVVKVYELCILLIGFRTL
jgi:chaperonin GroEL (HSP60 family)